ncbi:hypothetical protein ERO13_A09G043566v2 [Gossypium hirsutum]|nr:hypothetical protein ERO13_A09G043566v2 [Gossypium hirsutum]
MSEDDERQQSPPSDLEFVVMAFAFFFRRLMAFFSKSFVEKDYKLADTVIRGLLKYWPLTNCQKEVLFLGELEEVLEATQSVEFQRCMVPLFKQIARCLNSLHFQRITVLEILQDEWFKKWYKPPKFEQDEDVNLDDNILYFTWL